MAAEARHSVDWKDGFLFLGNNLALDFLNTRPVIDDKPTEFLHDFPSLLRWFRAAGLLGPHAISRLEKQYGNTCDAQLALHHLCRFREDFRNQIVRWEQGKGFSSKALAQLNRLLARHPLPSQLKVSGSTFAFESAFEPSSPEDLFGPILHAAATLLATADPSRVRQCDSCVLHFVDASKKGTRRWCSMQLCGNRVKVAAYHSRQRRH